jgi:oxaloacetate decarboxylase (Na+ extruding) subunit alpha
MPGMRAEKGKRAMNKKKVLFYDTTFRDGSQSIWSMFMNCGIINAVAEEMDRAGYHYIEIPAHGVFFKMCVRFMKENPWDMMHLFREKLKRTNKIIPIQDSISLLEEPEPRSMVRLFYEATAKATGAQRFLYMSNTRNELDRNFPWVVPMAREIGLEFEPIICYYPSPRTTDTYYAQLTQRIVEEHKPDALWLKDAGGLLTVERLKTLLPAIQKEAKGLPIAIHTHGMSTNSGRVIVEAMELGIDVVHTCVPPLANGCSHVSIFNAMHNAKILGLEHGITDPEALKTAEERLRRIGKLENLPVGVPLEYDHGIYAHQVPGGVIENLRTQLAQLGIPDKLDEVLDEVVRIIADLGYPIMITPSSQFVVSQAAVNVSTGERYGTVLDCMIETALGVWGWEDAGVPWMDPNVKDKFLSHPNAKILEEKYKKRQELALEEGSVAKIRATYGMTHASDEDFLLYHIMKGDTEIKQIRKPYKSYYTGKEPLVMLLKELGKDHDISRLQMKKGNSFFEFRQK